MSTKINKHIEQRRTGQRRAYFIVRDSKNQDHRLGLENTLTEEFVAELIKDGCVYCGETDPVQKSLDRIDNDIGHIQGNVVSACVRCNLIRRDMPFDAWLIVAPAIRRAKDAGLLGTWLHKRFRSSGK